MDIKRLYSEEGIAARVNELATWIREDAGDQEVLLIGVLKRTTVLLADLLRRITGPVRYEFIDVITDFSDTATADALEINFITHFRLAGSRVILLKDIVSSGIIETYLLSQLRQKRPDDIKLVAILDRPSFRTVPLEVDFSLFTVGEGKFVGYGLEYEDQHGNLPWIGTV